MEMNTSENFFFGDLLKQFRKRKRLNQTQLAERIEVKRETVSLWERGQYKPEADRILYKIVDVLGLTTQEQQQLFEAYTVTALATSFHNPPLKRNPYFTGRSPQLNKLHTLLMTGKQVALTQAISGLGGIGKTQLALEYAYRHQKSYHDIFWASADTEESLMASYVLLAGLLHLPEYEEPDQNKVKEAVQHWLRKHTGWLLILDNMEDLNLLQQFIPVDRQGAVLLTTRRHVTEPVAQALELELFPENDAILFLLKRTKVLAVEMSLEDASDHDIKAARAITQLLGNLPLALDQAGAYILETPCSFAEYLALFKKYQDRLLQRRIGERIPTDHPESVTATFRLNFQQVQQRSNAAGELLRICAFLASDAIPEEILTAGASLLGPALSPVAADAFKLNQAIEALRAYSLIRRDSKGKTLSIHRLIQAVLKDTLEETERRTWGKRAILAVNAAFPYAEHGTWPQCERLLPQALLVAQYIETDQIVGEEAGRLLYETASYLLDRARYVEAEPLYQRALRVWEQRLGPDHPRVASLLNNLANLYWQQGKYAEAEPLYQRALRIREQQLGPEHPGAAVRTGAPRNS
jgi:DNA-binding XRE family transcriptional regulator/tetratricopeptide (TPR) repeat protein